MDFKAFIHPEISICPTFSHLFIDPAAAMVDVDDGGAIKLMRFWFGFMTSFRVFFDADGESTQGQIPDVSSFELLGFCHRCQRVVR
ncbi:hypothetical protein Hdeb2414_s0014g00431371 [Helianthus debilis subsp. tardiflorus]